MGLKSRPTASREERAVLKALGNQAMSVATLSQSVELSQREMRSALAKLLQSGRVVKRGTRARATFARK